jgi:hypothetical protein
LGILPLVSPAKAVLFARPWGSVLKKNKNKKRKYALCQIILHCEYCRCACEKSFEIHYLKNENRRVMYGYPSLQVAAC